MYIVVKGYGSSEYYIAQLNLNPDGTVANLATNATIVARTDTSSAFAGTIRNALNA